MMQSQFLHHQQTWPSHETENDISFSFTTTEDDSPDQFLSTILVDHDDHEFQFSPSVGENFLDPFFVEESFSSQQFPLLMEEGENIWSPKSSESSIVFPPIQTSLALLGDDGQEGLKHLLMAYGEALGKGQMGLVEVIVKCLSEKVSPVGETLERIGFILCQSSGKQGEYLKGESIKNYEAAKAVFCQIFPYQKFAHFTANSAILEAVPENARTVHIVDFDMREGVQWPAMMEAIARRRKSLRLTSIKIREDNSEAHFTPNFEETKRRLCDHARSFGLNLTVDEVSIEDFVNERTTIIKRKGGGTEWLAFNCMVGLPHMGRGKMCRTQVTEFLKMGKELVNGSGIIVMGEGDASERLKFCSDYCSFFEGYLKYYQALCESMEWNFPDYFAEARLAIESLFVAPCASAVYWQQKWEEVRGTCDFGVELSLEGVRLSEENLLEAKEIARERESSYAVRIEGQSQNEIVLEWRGTPLVKVSSWR